MLFHVMQVHALNIWTTSSHSSSVLFFMFLCFLSPSLLHWIISLIYKNCINSGIFPNMWKKSNIIPVHKKSHKQVVDNYRLVSLLPIFSKILERPIFNSLFEFLHEKNLLHENQSGFRPSDSCEYQLIWCQRCIFECGMKNISIK